MDYNYKISSDIFKNSCYNDPGSPYAQVQTMIGQINEEEIISNLIFNLLVEKGADPNDPDFIDTPARVARMLSEIWLDKKEIDNRLKGFLARTFPSDKNSIVVVTGIHANSLCPHHLVPVSYEISFGYIPDGEELGLSKIARMCVEYAKQPLRQETYTTDIIRIFNENVKNKGAIILVRGIHGCMVFRGVKQSQSATVTTDASGEFINDSKVCKEFYDILKLERGK